MRSITELGDKFTQFVTRAGQVAGGAVGLHSRIGQLADEVRPLLIGQSAYIGYNW